VDSGDILVIRADSSGGPVVVVSALHDASTLRAEGATVVPVVLPGYGEDAIGEEDIVKKVTAACEFHRWQTCWG